MPADPDFLHALRAVCDETGILLVMDEVITGFRVGPRSGSGLYDITPDLSTLGKAIGGGLPAGAVAGRGDVVDCTLPGLPGDTSGRRPVNLAGTHAGNAMSAAAGVAHIDALLGDPDTYPRLARLGDRMRAGLLDLLNELGVEGYITGVGSMWGLHFSKEEPHSIRNKQRDNHIAGRLLAAYLLLEGVLMSSPVHLAFLSTAHTEQDVDAVIAAHRVALRRMQEDGCI
jgi:glutamate-1-semialdehyde 2,1-aminomutase